MSLYLASRVGAALIRQSWNAQCLLEHARSIASPLAFRSQFNFQPEISNLCVLRSSHISVYNSRTEYATLEQFASSRRARIA